MQEILCAWSQVREYPFSITTKTRGNDLGDINRLANVRDIARRMWSFYVLDTKEPQGMGIIYMRQHNEGLQTDGASFGVAQELIQIQSQIGATLGTQVPHISEPGR